MSQPAPFPPVRRPRITAREWALVNLFAVAVMLLTTLPYLAGTAAQTPEKRFDWFLFGVEDGFSYLAKMRAGARTDWAGWTIPIRYTSEPHDPALIFVPHQLWGKLAALAVPPDDPRHMEALLIAFHTARLVFGFALILVAYRFIAVFLRAKRLRGMALLLMLLGGGLGWLFFLTGNTEPLGSLPVDMYMPEGYSFFLLYGLPHLSLGRAALLGGLLCLFRADQLDESRRWARWSIGAGLCWTITVLCVPFYAAVIAALVGGWGLAGWFTTTGRPFPIRLFWRAVVAAIPVGITFAVSALSFYGNPIMARFQTQNLLPAPPLAHYLFGYGLAFLAALPAFVYALRRARQDNRFALLLWWGLAAIPLSYFPIEVQRRLIEGIFVPLSIFAIAGLRLWWIMLRRALHRRLRLAWRLALIGFLGLSLGTPLLFMASGAVLAATGNPQLFHAAALYDALDWLNANAPADSVILTSGIPLGNLIPARTNLRAYIGHSVETIDYRAKRAQVEAFYAGTLDAEARAALLREGNIAYILYGPDDPAPLDDLILAYQAGDYRVYRASRP